MKDEFQLNSIREAIKIIALRKGIKINYIAKKIGVTPQTLSTKLKKERFSIKELFKIADILDYSINISWTKKIK